MAFISFSSFANEKVVAAEAVLGNLVVLSVDGKRHKLRVGESLGSIKLLQATNQSVIVSISGQERRLKVGAAAIRTSYSVSKKIEKISRDSVGMYKIVGGINNRPATMLVDTGATFVTLSEKHAEELGVDFRNGKTLFVSTANGVVPAYSLKLKVVNVGSISLKQVEAVVLTGTGMDEVLLGMSFLNRLNVSYKSGVMTMESK